MPTKIFISYSHQDAMWLARVGVHLNPLRRMYEIDIWDDRKIKPGSRWREEIAEAVRASKVAILLISADFLSSDFIVQNELPPLLAAAEEKGALILPLIVSPSYFLRTEGLSKFQTVNDPAKPLVNVSKGEQEQILVQMAETIEAFLVSSSETGSDSEHVADSTNKEIEPRQVPIKELRSEEVDHAVEIKSTKSFRPYGSDLRPVIDAWVGREEELQSFKGLSSGVVVVTGIGGQGKSYLVAKFLETALKQKGLFWDWRDCREEGEQFFTQLVSLIEHFTGGRVGGEQVSGADVRSVIRYFFELVGDEHGVIVLDNVDHYVNHTDGKFRLGVGAFVEETLRANRNLLIVLTCRPRVTYASARFLEIPLGGVDLSEATQLFRLRSVKITAAMEDQIQEIWSRTHGHPLWLTLIATQMSRNRNTGPEILKELRKSHDDRARSMFRALWKGLNNNQRSILRCMAEIQYPESYNAIQDFVGTLIPSRNHFRRAFEGLRSLSLVVERGSTVAGSNFDLHPLVRNFVRTEYPSRQERLPFINIVLLVLGRLIGSVEEPSHDAPFEDLQRWSAKAELELESDNYLDALGTISRSSDQLVARGFHEEFFRVAMPIVDHLNWASIEIQESRYFHDVIVDMISSLVEHNREQEARTYLDRYEKAAGTTVARLRFLKVACYVEWMLGNYDRAIRIGQEGLTLKNQSDVDTNTTADVGYHFALALRDNGQWDEALKIFAPDQSVSDIVRDDPIASGKSASFYGNVGRCLQNKNELPHSLECYLKSAFLLERSSSSEDILNRGYAALWIGEVLEEMNSLNDAYCFYRYAVHVWSRRAPLRVSSAIERLLVLEPRISSKQKELSDREIELHCQRWISENSKKRRWTQV